MVGVIMGISIVPFFPEHPYLTFFLVWYIVEKIVLHEGA